MHLTWNEIRVRAARFAEEWKDGHYERGESQTFYNEFFEVFGVTRRRVASFEEPVRLLGDKRGFLDLFWKGVLLVEQKSAGLDSRATATASNICLDCMRSGRATFRHASEDSPRPSKTSDSMKSYAESTDEDRDSVISTRRQDRGK